MNERIVVVDDDAIILRNTESTLSGMYKVTCLKSGRMFLDFVKKNPVDMLLLDIRMPEMDGFETLKALREWEKETGHKTTPCIFLTADDDGESETMGLSLGAMDFIRKPFVPDVLKLRVGNLLELIKLQNDLHHEVELKTAELESLSIHVVQTLAEAIDAKDNYTNGRPPLDLGGALYTTRKTVDEVETMKVTTCLNPLHTAMSIYGCLLGYTLISAEMADEDIRAFIQKIGYIEAMPVVTDPGVLNPYEFIGAVINRRLPNPFMPDAPQRIAMDTSQKLPIRFGETIKKYLARGLDKSNLVLIPLTLAGYARYLKGIKDNGEAFEPSPDPLLEELQAIVAPLEVGKPDQDFSCLRQLYSRKDIFAVDLYEAGLGEQIEGMVKELYADFGAVRRTLHKYVVAR